MKTYPKGGVSVIQRGMVTAGYLVKSCIKADFKFNQNLVHLKYAKKRFIILNVLAHIVFACQYLAVKFYVHPFRTIR